jgi:hypothetical protein
LAEILPFPRVKDRAFIRRHARRMIELGPRAAEKHLAVQLDVQRRTMARRGIDPALAEEQLQQIETAIRSELCRLRLEASHERYPTDKT